MRDDDGEVQGGMLVAVETVTEAEERLTTRLRQQSAVAELGKFAVAGGAEFDVLIEQAARLVSETLTVDAVSVVELLGNCGEYLVRLDSAGQFTGRRSPIAGSLCEKVQSTRTPVVIDDAALPEHEVPPALLAAGARSIAYIPIGPVANPLGMLGAFSFQPARVHRRRRPLPRSDRVRPQRSSVPREGRRLIAPPGAALRRHRAAESRVAR